jgi:hypothetical protein
MKDVLGMPGEDACGFNVFLIARPTANELMTIKGYPNPDISRGENKYL